VNLREDIKQLRTDARNLRQFGLVVGGVFAALGLLYWLRLKPAFPYFLTPGTLLIALGLAAPRALKHVYLAWMSLAFVLGFVASNVLLIMFFFLVITPIGLVARCWGSDFLSLKLNRAAASYWIPRQRKPGTQTEYERQF
jgi:hypothetical protein